MARDGFDGLGKMRKGEKPEYKPKPMEGKKMNAESNADHAGVNESVEGAHSIHDHGDGTFHTEHPDGTREEHPHHMAAMAHVGHKITGGDKHHVVHHDGMVAHSHSIHEDGQHEDHGEHNSADEARGALDKFLGEEANEPEHQDGGGEDEGPVMGGM
jgi:hypothetical protein